MTNPASERTLKLPSGLRIKKCKPYIEPIAFSGHDGDVFIHDCQGRHLTRDGLWMHSGAVGKRDYFTRDAAIEFAVLHADLPEIGGRKPRIELRETGMPVATRVFLIATDGENCCLGKEGNWQPGYHWCDAYATAEGAYNAIQSAAREAPVEPKPLFKANTDGTLSFIEQPTPAPPTPAGLELPDGPGWWTNGSLTVCIQDGDQRLSNGIPLGNWHRAQPGDGELRQALAAAREECERLQEQASEIVADEDELGIEGVPLMRCSPTLPAFVRLLQTRLLTRDAQLTAATERLKAAQEALSVIANGHACSALFDSVPLTGVAAQATARAALAQAESGVCPRTHSPLWREVMAKKRKRSIKEVQAAVAFVDGVVPRADIMNGIAPKKIMIVPCAEKI